MSAHFPVLMLTGPRQVGKTTLLETCAEPERHYVTLDDIQQRELAQNDPQLFLKTHQAPLMIDEVQYAPQLFSAIKLRVDQQKQNGLYWLTGSQKFHLMRGIHESLAGRVGILDLLGFSRAEMTGRFDQVMPFLPTEQWLAHYRKQPQKSGSLQEIYETIWLGSYPKLYDAPGISRDIFYRSYLQTYINRDVRDLLHISNETLFARFVRVVAARTGQLLNYADLARDADIDQKTVKSWLSVLETSGLIYLLQPYYGNITKRMIKAPKLYFLDTGLCSYLTQWPTSAALESGAMSGAILETFLLTEILKSYWHLGQEPYFYYYRDQDQKEIDLVIEQGDTLYPVEFKKTASPAIHAAKSFHLLEKFQKKVGMGAVFCFVDKDVPLSASVQAIPVAYL